MTLSDADFRRIPPFDLDEMVAPFRIGLIALSSDLITERDFGSMLPDDGSVTFCTARVPLAIPVTVENLRLMGSELAAAASLLLPTSDMQVIAYSCTSGSVAMGPEEVERQIRKGRPGVKVVTPISAVLAALAHSDVKRISLLTPYSRDVTRSMADYLGEHGIEILNCSYFDLLDDQDMARLTPDDIYKAALETISPDADSIFISCTGIRTVEAISRLEEELGRPVFCSNQCMFWQSLRLAGYDKPLPGFGQLLMS